MSLFPKTTLFLGESLSSEMATSCEQVEGLDSSLLSALAGRAQPTPAADASPAARPRWPGEVKAGVFRGVPGVPGAAAALSPAWCPPL